LCLATLQSDLNQALSEKDAVEQEILSGKLAAERSERQARQEQNRLQAEINSYKQRLERGDADLMHCRRENLRLSEHIASLEKEVIILDVISKFDDQYYRIMIKIIKFLNFLSHAYIYCHT